MGFLLEDSSVSIGNGYQNNAVLLQLKTTSDQMNGVTGLLLFMSK